MDGVLEGFQIMVHRGVLSNGSGYLLVCTSFSTCGIGWDGTDGAGWEWVGMGGIAFDAKICTTDIQKIDCITRIDNESQYIYSLPPYLLDFPSKLYSTFKYLHKLPI